MKFYILTLEMYFLILDFNHFSYSSPSPKYPSLVRYYKSSFNVMLSKTPTCRSCIYPDKKGYRK